MATEHRLGSPYFTNLLQSTLSTHLRTPHYLKGLENLLLTQTQYVIFDAQWKKGLEALLVKSVGLANQSGPQQAPAQPLQAVFAGPLPIYNLPQQGALDWTWQPPT